MARDIVEVRLESSDFSTEKIQIHKLSGKEVISQLFSFDLEIACLDPDNLDVAAMEGASATLVFERQGLELRRIHGMLVEIDDMLESEVEYRTLRLRFMPRAFRLTLIETQEIYMDLSVPDIIKQKLELVSLGSSDVEFRLKDTYPKREFVVQYKETDLAFISRLTEHLGISFFFEHEGGVDRIIFTDHNAGFRYGEREKVPFQPRGEKNEVFKLESKTRLIPTSYVLQDYNYRKPLVDLTSSAEAPSGFAGGVVEQGAHFKDPDEGKGLAQVRAEEREATHRVFSGESDVCHLAAGVRFTLDGHPLLDKSALLVTEVEHRASQVVGMHGGSDKEDYYLNSFKAIDAGLTYRPPRLTPKPRIFGVTTGIVEEPRAAVGNHALIDGQGRYTVKFLFDTAAPGERKASHPVRMLQPHAGPDYGVHFPLKPGVEVLLAFIDGDPDRPIIVGAVPNPITPSPVVSDTSSLNRIKSASGVIIEMRDVFKRPS